MENSKERSHCLLEDVEHQHIHSFSIQDIMEVQSKQLSVKGVGFAILSNCIWSLGPLSLALLYKYSNISSFEIVYWKSLFMDVANVLLAWY